MADLIYVHVKVHVQESCKIVAKKLAQHRTVLLLNSSGFLAVVGDFEANAPFEKSVCCVLESIFSR